MARHKTGQLFENHIHWSNSLPLYFYNLMWQTLEKEELLPNITEEDQLESFLYECVLIDFFKDFETYASDEYWSAEEFDDEDYPVKNYEAICQLLKLKPMMIEDLYSEEELAKEAFSDNDIQAILEEERPTFSDLFAEHIQPIYRQKVLSALRNSYAQDDLFALMANALAYNRYAESYWDNYDEGQEDYSEELLEVTDLDSFIESSKQNEENLLNDMEFVQAHEWLTSIY